MLQGKQIPLQNFPKGWVPETDVTYNSAPEGSCSDCLNVDFDYVKGAISKSNGYVIDIAAYQTVFKQYADDGYEIKYIRNFAMGTPVDNEFVLVILHNDAKTDSQGIANFDETFMTSNQSKWVWLLRGGITNDALTVGWTVLNNCMFKYPDEADAILAYDALFNCVLASYTNITCDVVNNVLRVGLGKIVHPVWIGYIHRYMLPTAATPTYEFETDSFILTHRTPDLTVNLPAASISMVEDTAGFLESDRDIELFVTGTYDGFQEVVTSRTYTDSVSTQIRSAITMCPEMISGGIILDKVYLNNIPNLINHLGYSDDLCGLSEKLEMFTGATKRFTIYFLHNSYKQGDFKPITFQMMINEIYLAAVPSNTLFVNDGLDVEHYINPAPPAIVKITKFTPSIFQQSMFDAINNGNLLGGARRIAAVAASSTFGGDFEWTAGAPTDLPGNTAPYIYATKSNPNLNYHIGEGVGICAHVGGAAVNPDEWKWIKTNCLITDQIETFILLNQESAFKNPVNGLTNRIISAGIGWDIPFSGLGSTGTKTSVVIQDKYTYHLNPTTTSSQKMIFTLGLEILHNFNRRLTNINIWARYKPNIADDYYQFPFFLVKTFYINKVETTGIYKTEEYWTEKTTDPTYKIFCIEADLKAIPELGTKNPAFTGIDIRALPQLLPRIVYEPKVPIDLYYECGIIHNGFSFNARTQNEQDVIQVNRLGGNGVSELDIFSYDFENQIGFETVMTDYPGRIMAMCSTGTELVILRNNSVLVATTEADNFTQLRVLSKNIGCAYPRSVVYTSQGVVFADKNGIWWYRGGMEDIIQLNWQWDVFYKTQLSDGEKLAMFGTWNSSRGEYWLFIKDRIFIADFNAMQSLDQAVAVMVTKERIWVPWRKKQYYATPVDMTSNSIGEIVFASNLNESSIYFDNRDVYYHETHGGSHVAYASTFVDTHTIGSPSPLMTFNEMSVLTLPCADASPFNWWMALEIFADTFSTARQRLLLSGCDNNIHKNGTICSRPLNLGFANAFKFRLILDETAVGGTTTASTGLNAKTIVGLIISAQTKYSKYVTE